MSCLYILEINPLSVTSFANILSHPVGCLFILFMFSFAEQKLLSLIRSHLFIFVFIFVILGGGSKRYCWDFPGSAVAKTLCSEYRGPRFDPWSGNKIPNATTKSLHALTKDPTGHTNTEDLTCHN